MGACALFGVHTGAHVQRYHEVAAGRGHQCDQPPPMANGMSQPTHTHQPQLLNADDFSSPVVSVPKEVAPLSAAATAPRSSTFLAPGRPVTSSVSKSKR